MKTMGSFLAVPITVIVAKLATFLFDALLSSFYGAGTVSDSFIMAYSIPIILFDGIVLAIISCYIPIYERLRFGGSEEFKNYSSNLFTMSVLMGVIAAVLFVIFREPLLSLYAKGFTSAGRRLLEKYVCILIWSIPISAGCGIFRAYLQLQNKKAMSNISQILVYTVMMAALAITYPQDNFLAWSVVMGNILCAVVLGSCAYKNGLTIRPYLSFRVSYCRPFFLMMLPVVLSTLLGEINSIVDKYFSSFLEAGIITSMTLSYKLSFSIQSIIGTSLMLILYPVLAQNAAAGRHSDFAFHLKMSNKLIGWLCFPLIVGCLVLAEPLVQLIFGHGKFTEENVHVTAVLFAIYLTGVMPMCLKNVSDKAFYAMEKPKYTLYASLLSVAVNIGLDIIAYGRFQYIGLAAATSVSILVGALAQWVMLRKYDKNMIEHTHFGVLIKPLGASLVMGAGVALTGRLLTALSLGIWWSTMICVVVGVFIYGFFPFVIFRRDGMEMLDYIKSMASGEEVKINQA